MEKLSPIMYAAESRVYYGIGEYIGKAFKLGATIG
jgi:hypothetical protein